MAAANHPGHAMNQRIAEILQHMRELEAELEAELESRREAFHVRLEHHRIRFDREILERQRRFKVGLIDYFRGAELRTIITAPIIYSMIVPLVLLDVSVTIYQFFCFPMYRIQRVKRADFMAFDRRHLAYLNVIEKFHCTYCSYANGLAAYVKEIIARTEQFWCPIRHARRLLQTHSRYNQFMDYGDAKAYRQDLQALRDTLNTLPPGQKGKYK